MDIEQLAEQECSPQQPGDVAQMVIRRKEVRADPSADGGNDGGAGEHGVDQDARDQLPRAALAPKAVDRDAPAQARDGDELRTGLGSGP